MARLSKNSYSTMMKMKSRQKTSQITLIISQVRVRTFNSQKISLLVIIIVIRKEVRFASPNMGNFI
jgi:hypothetical protein